MMTVEQLRGVQPDLVAALGREQAARADTVSAVITTTVESVGQDLAGWHGPAATASTAHRHAIADDAARLRDAHAAAATAIATLADRLDEARQLLDLADSFAALVDCRVSGHGEVSALPPRLLGPLAAVYDSVRRAAGSLAVQALTVAEAADHRAVQVLGGTPADGTADRPQLTESPAPPTDASPAGPLTGPPADLPTGPPPADRTPADRTPAHRTPAGHPAAPLTGPRAGQPAAPHAGPQADLPTGPLAGQLAAPHAGPSAGPAPATLDERYAATRAHLAAVRDELRRARTELAGVTRTVAAGRTLDAINQRIGTLNSFLACRTVTTIDPGSGEPATVTAVRRFLSFDPSGAGRVAEVIGDAAAAGHVALLVPGAHNSLDTLNALATDARLLADAAGPDTAVIVWLGYDSVGVGGLTGAILGTAAFGDAAARHRARTAGPADGTGDAAGAGSAGDAGRALRRFLAGLAPGLRPGAHLTVIGHGYGTVPVAAALRAGCRPHDVILVGSPGLGPRIRSAADLCPASPVRVTDPPPVPRLWTMRAPGDTIAYSREFGADPAEFSGVIRLETQGGTEVVGHTRYYAVGSESLDNLARIVAGRRAEITVTTISIDEELMLAGLPRPALRPGGVS